MTEFEQDVWSLTQALGNAAPGAKILVDAEALRRLLQQVDEIEVLEAELAKADEALSEYVDLQSEKDRLETENKDLGEVNDDNQRYISELQDDIEALKAEIDAWKELLG